MAIKTFTTGEVLTAADTNTYLANSGLVYIGETTIGSAVATVTTGTVFSSTYDSYRVVIRGVRASTGTDMLINFGSTTTGYYCSLYYDAYTGSSTGVKRNNNGANIYIALLESSLNETISTLDIANPFLALSTSLAGNYYGNSYSGWFGGTQASSTSFTTLTIRPTSGTLTGGTIAVYGYRKA
jgi:hypothetical protein